MKVLKAKNILTILLILSLCINVSLTIILVQRRGEYQMLLCEQERILSAEQNLLKNYNLYTTSSTSLTTIHDYGNITVPAGGALVYFTGWLELATVSDSNATAYADFILQIAGNAAAGKHLSIAGTPPVTGTALGTLGSVIWLNAGTYDILVQGSVDNAASSAMVYGLMVGIASFNDLQTSAFQNYTGATNNISLTVAARNTPVGPLNQAVYAVTIGSNKAYGSGLSVQVDGVTQTGSDEDAGVGGTGTYCYKLFIPLTVGVSHTITLVLSSASVYASVVACPWLLTGPRTVQNLNENDGHFPVTLSFSQLSTLYVNLGSLFYDTTKDAYIGVSKGVTFGASDFYAQGIISAGVLAFNYNFTSVNVAIASFIVDGLGGCIENIGVDIA